MNDDDDQLHSISRRPAKSGKVSFGDPVILHESSKIRVVFLPFFSHTGIAPNSHRRSSPTKS